MSQETLPDILGGNTGPITSREWIRLGHNFTAKVALVFAAYHFNGWEAVMMVCAAILYMPLPAAPTAGLVLTKTTPAS